MGSRKAYGIILSLGVLMVAYQNCTDVKFSSTQTPAADSKNDGQGNPTGDDTGGVDDANTTPGGTDVGVGVPPKTVGEVIDSCAKAEAQGKLLVKEEEIIIDDTKQETGRNIVCQDTVSDAKDNDFLRHRYEQDRSFSLGEKAVLCDMELSVPNKTFNYDDVFYFMFNGRILAANLGTTIPKTDSEIVKIDGKDVKMHTYDWLKVKDSTFKGVEEGKDNYCLGATEGLSTCKWPITQQTGDIEMSFSQKLIVAMGLKSTDGVQKFKFSTTADNDPTSDCYHSRLDVRVKAKYYLRK